jgi:hypothetical protein
MSDLSPRQTAFLTKEAHAAAFEDMSADELDRLSFADYAEMTGRGTATWTTPTTQTPAPTATQVTDENAELYGQAGQQPVSVGDMDMDAYAEYRRANGVGGGEYGVGILGGNDRDAWMAAAAKKSGRSAMVTGNVTESPRLTGRFVNHDEKLDRRGVAQRFGTPGNEFIPE